jgi:hypothetical protein
MAAGSTDYVIVGAAHVRSKDTSRCLRAERGQRSAAEEVYVMRDLRERAAERLLSISVTHALDSLEIKQRHRSMPPHPARDRCDEMVLIADFISRVSLRLATKLAPAESRFHAPSG